MVICCCCCSIWLSLRWHSTIFYMCNMNALNKASQPNNGSMAVNYHSINPADNIMNANRTIAFCYTNGRQLISSQYNYLLIVGSIIISMIGQSQTQAAWTVYLCQETYRKHSHSCSDCFGYAVCVCIITPAETHHPIWGNKLSMNSVLGL